MARESSVAHTRGQILRELMGRANFMSRDVRRAKRANQRENNLLREIIDGKHGINSQFRHMIDRANLEADVARREFAETRYRGKWLNPKEFCRKFENKTDPLEILMMEREKLKRKRKEKMLNRLKVRSERADTRVKNFIEEIEDDILKSKLPVLPSLNVTKAIQPDFVISRPSSANRISEESSTRPDINDENSAPDGRLRAMFTLPDIEERWEGAKRARYVRTRLFREFERELTFNEIFRPDAIPSISLKRSGKENLHSAQSNGFQGVLLRLPPIHAYGQRQ